MKARMPGQRVEHRMISELTQASLPLPLARFSGVTLAWPGLNLAIWHVFVVSEIVYYSSVYIIISMVL